MSYLLLRIFIFSWETFSFIFSLAGVYLNHPVICFSFCNFFRIYFTKLLTLKSSTMVCLIINLISLICFLVDGNLFIITHKQTWNFYTNWNWFYLISSTEQAHLISFNIENSNSAGKIIKKSLFKVCKSTCFQITEVLQMGFKKIWSFRTTPLTNKKKHSDLFVSKQVICEH